MTISVAMATFNGEPYLSDQLDSLLEQERKPDELVVCDDGSTDGTIDRLKSFSEDAPFAVRVYENGNNLGPTKNFEKSIELCKGDFIALSDQDDVWRPEKLRRFEKRLSESPEIGLLFSDAQLVDGQLNSLGPRLWDEVGFGEQRREKVRQDGCFEELVLANFITGMTTIFRASLREKICPVPSGWMHDYWIALIVSAASEVAFVEEPLVDYRIHQDNEMGVGLNRSIVDRLRAALRNKPDHYSETADRFQELYDRLHPLAERGWNIQAELGFIAGMIDHSRKRARMSDSLGNRMKTIYDELKRRRYHKYSRGYGSALKDAMFST